MKTLVFGSFLISLTSGRGSFFSGSFSGAEQPIIAKLNRARRYFMDFKTKSFVKEKGYAQQKQIPYFEISR